MHLLASTPVATRHEPPRRGWSQRHDASRAVRGRANAPRARLARLRVDARPAPPVAGPPHRRSPRQAARRRTVHVSQQVHQELGDGRGRASPRDGRGSVRARPRGTRRPQLDQAPQPRSRHRRQRPQQKVAAGEERPLRQGRSHPASPARDGDLLPGHAQKARHRRGGRQGAQRRAVRAVLLGRQVRRTRHGHLGDAVRALHHGSEAGEQLPLRHRQRIRRRARRLRRRSPRPRRRAVGDAAQGRRADAVLPRRRRPSGAPIVHSRVFSLGGDARAGGGHDAGAVAGGVPGRRRGAQAVVRP